MTARDLAHRAFWTEHPLCQLYALAHGHWQGRDYVPTGQWSIRQLITFAETLPQHVIEALAGDA
jgi:hypothetical protein